MVGVGVGGTNLYQLVQKVTLVDITTVRYVVVAIPCHNDVVLIVHNRRERHSVITMKSPYLTEIIIIAPK